MPRKAPKNDLLNPISDPEKAMKAGIARLNEDGRRTLQAMIPLTENQAVLLSRLVQMPAEAFRQEIASRFQSAIGILTERLISETNNLRTDQLAINIGILSDKYKDMTGITAPTTVNTTNIQINGVSRESATALLTNRRSKANSMPIVALDQPKTDLVLDLQPKPLKELVMAGVADAVIVTHIVGVDDFLPPPKDLEQVNNLTSVSVDRLPDMVQDVDGQA